MTATVTVAIPQDAAARSVGADAVADALAAQAAARGDAVRVVRTGSRGMCFLEPLVEVATAAGRIAYGPVAPEDVASLLDAGMLDGGPHPLRHGVAEEIPYFARQERLTFARVGVIEPADLDEYRRHGGLRGLERALHLAPAQIVEAVADSGLRGRGGAAFPTGIKWRTVAGAPGARRHIACNADEGDSGTFSDRMLMEGDPFALIEGMAIAARAVGAGQGFVYLRSEYPDARRTLQAAIDAARAANVLGERILGSDLSFDIEIRLNAGAYVCGEETSMLESLEGKRGMIRPKPPLPALEGLFGEPTVVNNVITLATVPWILEHGAEAYAAFGTGRSRGTIPVQLAGNVKQGGLVEVPFGVTLRDLIEGFGAGTASGRPFKAVQIGGPLGAWFDDSRLDTPLDYEALAAQDGGIVGHGGLVVFDDTVDMAAMARFAMEFCALESCGKCTPCRVGSVRGVELIDRIAAGADLERDVALLDDLCDTMTHGSLCALGGLTPLPVQSALRRYPQDFGLARDRRPAS